MTTPTSTESDPSLPATTPPPARPILVSVLVVATCGLVYELISATMASYLLGDSVTQWSLVIGVYLSAMGLGSWLSKFIEHRLHRRFIDIQLLIAVIGGFSAPALFLGFAYLASVRPLLFAILTLVGTMVGLEIPLLMRILEGGQTLKDLVARVLAFDYLGALAASILFPLALLPHLGLVRTSLLFGVLNALVALWATFAFASALPAVTFVRARAVTVLTALGVAFAAAPHIETFGESQLYDFPVIFSRKTPYQRLTLTRWRSDIRLYIDGNLQFSSSDEHRYHESLVHLPMAVALARPGERDALRAVVLGGGDGLALRELVKYPELGRIDLVDLDPEMTTLFSEHPVLTTLNEGAFADPRVHVHNTDAMEWLLAHRRADGEPFDVAIVDLPDPNNFSLGKLYTREFYRLLASVLDPHAAGVIQSTSPYLSPRSFWCIQHTLEAAGLRPAPYHVHVPSFGDWGFALIAPRPFDLPLALPEPAHPRYLTDALLPSLFVFPGDQPEREVEINRLNDQLLVHYYEADLDAPLGLRGP